MLHAKALLLVDDHQAQIVRIDVCGKQSVRSYQHIYASVRKSLKRLSLLSRRDKTRKHAYLQIKRSKSREKRLVVLLSQDGSWAQNHDLASVLARLKRSSKRHLCLAKAHVAAKQAIHRLSRFHVQFNVCNSAFLVWRQLVREAGLHLFLCGSVQRERIAWHRSATRIEIYQVKRKFLGGLSCFVSSARPICRVKPGQARIVAVGPHITRDAVNLLQGYIEFIVIGVLKQEVITLSTCNFLTHDGRKVRNTVRCVDNVVARLKRERDRCRVNALGALLVARAPGRQVRDRKHC